MFCQVPKSDSGSEACLFTIAGRLGFIIWRLKPHNSLLFLFLLKLFWRLQRDLLFCCIKVGLFLTSVSSSDSHALQGLDCSKCSFPVRKMIIHFLSLCISLILFYRLVRRHRIGQKGVGLSLLGLFGTENPEREACKCSQTTSSRKHFMMATAPSHVLTSTLTLISLFCIYFFSLRLHQAARGATLLCSFQGPSSWRLIGFHVFLNE